VVEVLGAAEVVMGHGWGAGLAPIKRSNVRLMQVNRRSDSPDAQVNQFHKN
jgi:hypothetical protein